MSEWKVYNLGEIGFFTNGVNKSKISFGHGYPFVNLLDIFDKDRIDYIPKGLVDVNQDELNRYNIKNGDILFVRSSVKLDGVGKACAVTKDLKNTIFSGFIIRFRQPNLILNNLFSSYYLNSFPIRNQIISKATLSANSNINQQSLKTIQIEIPSLPTQRRIAHILSTIDSVIEKTQSAIEKYKAIKQGMLHDLFTRGIDLKTGILRPRYQDAPELYKPSKLGWIPNEWEIKEIGNVSSLVTNGFVGIATPYYTTADKGVPYLYGTNIREDSIEFNDLRYISREFNNSHVKSQLKPGDMLCVQSGHIGTCAVVPDNFVEANCHALIITRFYKEIIYPEFISFYLNSSIGQHHLDKIIIGSTIKHINTSDLAKHLIPIPLFEEQKEISRRLLVIDQKLRTEQNYFHKLQMLKSGLMSDLLSGKKRVKVDDEDLSKTA